MIYPLPEELHDDKNEGFWEWDDGKPKAKANAPEKLRRAIEKWQKEAEEAENDLMRSLEGLPEDNADGLDEEDEDE